MRPLPSKEVTSEQTIVRGRKVSSTLNTSSAAQGTCSNIHAFQARSPARSSQFHLLDRSTPTQVLTQHHTIQYNTAQLTQLQVSQTQPSPPYHLLPFTLSLLSRDLGTLLNLHPFSSFDSSENFVEHLSALYLVFHDRLSIQFNFDQNSIWLCPSLFTISIIHPALSSWPW